MTNITTLVLVPNSIIARAVKEFYQNDPASYVINIVSDKSNIGVIGKGSHFDRILILAEHTIYRQIGVLAYDELMRQILQINPNAPILRS